MPPLKTSGRPSLIKDHFLSYSMAKGQGHYPTTSGKLLNSRWYIIRMLEREDHSTVYLVGDITWDRSPKEHPASENQFTVKIISAWATAMNHQGGLHELNVLKALRGAPNNLPQLQDHFEIDGPHGRHTCFVLPVASVSVEQFLSGNGVAPFLRPQLVQHIVYKVLTALSGLHQNQIVHTGKSFCCLHVIRSSLTRELFLEDVRADNILIRDTRETTPIDPLEGNVLIRGNIWTALLGPQPILPVWQRVDDESQLKRFNICLNGLGSTIFTPSYDSINTPTSPLTLLAEWLGKKEEYHPIRVCTAPAMRAPELILEAGFDEKIDVWAIGCLTYQLLTGQPLFDTREITCDEYHLAHIVAITGETFSKAMLARSKRREEFFPEGHLKVTLPPTPIEDLLARHQVLQLEDIQMVADFIRACLHINPALRPSAYTLKMYRIFDDPLQSQNKLGSNMTNIDLIQS